LISYASRADAMVGGAAAATGVLSAQQGRRRFSVIEDGDAPGGGLDESARGRGDARKDAEEMSAVSSPASSVSASDHITESTPGRLTHSPSALLETRPEPTNPAEVNGFRRHLEAGSSTHIDWREGAAGALVSAYCRRQS
jgi:hypothetical protein